MSRLLLLVAAIICLIAGSASAEDLASTSFAASTWNDKSAVVHLTVTSHRTLRMRLEIFDDPFDWPPRVGDKRLPFKRRTRIRHLSPAVFDHLRDDIKSLANVELEETFGDYVCLMVPSALDFTGELDVIRGYDWETDSFTGEIERVMSGPWCWAGHGIRPTEQWARNRADRFKEKLRILAAQFLGRRIDEILRW